MKAMVLCAGFGTRLGEITREIPKPMLEIEGRPLLSYILANLKRHGFDQIVINLHFRPEIIRDYFGDGSRFGLNLAYSFEPLLLGTAGGVKNVEGFFKGERDFLIHYGDIITNQNFVEMVQFHRSRQAEATLLVHERVRSNSILVLDAERRLIRFLERPTDEERMGVTSPWVNSGVSVCGPSLFQATPAGAAADLPRDIFPRMAKNARVFGFPLSGVRVAVDSPERLAQAREMARAGLVVGF